MRLVPDEPSFNKVGTLLAAVCWLLLDAPECRGKLRSSEAVIVASYSCWKLMLMVGKLIGVCSLLTLMQNTASQPVSGIGSARWPDGPLQSGVPQPFNLSGVGEAVGGVSEAVGDERTGGNGVEGTFNKDMTLEAHKETVKPLSQTRSTSAVRRRAQREVFVCTARKSGQRSNKVICSVSHL